MQASAIQLPYHTSEKSIWKYAEAINLGKVDFTVFVVGKCPLCGKWNCLREITPYKRGIIELFPWRTGEIPVARFLCRKLGLTVSLLPVELVPYHRYTLRSILLALFLFHAVWGDPECTLEDVWNELPPDSNVTVYLLRYWLGEVLRGLRRAHAKLHCRYGLSGVRTGLGLSGQFSELQSYFHACGIRGPPDGNSAVAGLAADYSRSTNRFLVGRTSQERCR